MFRELASKLAGIRRRESRMKMTGIEDAGPVNPREVNAVGVLLGDKKAGAFKLEVAWIKRVDKGER
ncbi:MAG: hypothetical protein IPQ07_26345 [Myxococcales bacterium]|nr:hypothetical protein [Myxococcales bacterium]